MSASDHDAALPPFDIVERRVAYEGFTRLEVLDLVQVNRAGVAMRMKREIETHGDGAAVLAYDPLRRQAVLVKQLRVPIGLVLPKSAYALEVIAGLIDHAGDDAAATAKREAMEEAGLHLAALTKVADVFASPGISTERLALFLAEIDLDVAHTSVGGGLASEQEDIEVVTISLQSLADMADEGAILDLKTYALIQTLRLRRPDLFVG